VEDRVGLNVFQDLGDGVRVAQIYDVKRHLGTSDFARPCDGLATTPAEVVEDDYVKAGLYESHSYV
jgi:hypothetical protein